MGKVENTDKSILSFSHNVFKSPPQRYSKPGLLFDQSGVNAFYMDKS